ncbi:HAMP domain-containing sensor histidine kinase [Clostridium carnis]
MKEKIRNYIKGVWGIEIVICIILMCSTIIGYYQSLNNSFSDIGAGSFDALLDKDSYIESMIYYDSRELAHYIYDTTNNLQYIEPIEVENSYLVEKNYYDQNMFYIIFNKETGNFVTNDLNMKNYISSYKYNTKIMDEKIHSYIDENGLKATTIDNVKKFNYYVAFNDDDLKNKSIKDYTEVYYKYPSGYNYLVRADSLTAKLIILSTIVTIILLLKIIINIIFNRKNIHLEIKVLSRLIYVLKYGLKYKTTRNKILISIGGSIVVIVAYLYLVAGIRNQNVLVTFLTRYPFKGTLILVLIPLVCVIYSLKKSLDVSIINDGLKKINSGDLEHNLNDIGEREVKELVYNINQIKDGYKIALNEKIKNEKLKTELISNVSHDLKTPLTSIINYVNILNDENITEEERKDYLKILEQKSMRLKTLIEDLFEVSKLNSGKMTINKSEVDIVSLVHQVVGEYCNLYEEKNIEFKVTTNKEEIFFKLDGKLMSRVFENIIINALKYSLDNTRVYISILDNDDHVEISFKNISNYEMDFNTEDIFERFARADKSRTSSIEGSGMGLAITKSIVELHNGKINIQVEGDMFKMYLLIPKK